jgi:DNA invertase Pin-like site-specific DNA recombinase
VSADVEAGKSGVVFDSLNGRRGRGRPSRSLVPTIRERRTRAVYLLLAGTLTAGEIARAFGIDRRTLYRWRAELLADGESDTEGLRRLAR